MNSLFKHCPVCKSDDISINNVKHLLCKTCGFEYFHNTAAAVAVFLEYKGKVLVVERNRNPGAGMLDLPGGFVDPMESGEEALVREIREELAIEPVNIDYLFSVPNKYHFKNIDYYTLDIFFTAQLNSDQFTIEKEEIRSIQFFSPLDINENDFCFLSMKKAIKLFKEKLSDYDQALVK